MIRINLIEYYHVCEYLKYLQLYFYNIFYIYLSSWKQSVAIRGSRETLRTFTSSEMTLHNRHRLPGGPCPKMTTDCQKVPQIERARFDYGQTDMRAKLRKVCKNTIIYV